MGLEGDGRGRGIYRDRRVNNFTLLTYSRN